jgi:thiamine-phosphate pyrophosphorylase
VTTTPFLYLITPPHLPDAAGFSRDLDTVLAAGAGLISAVQIRLKDSDDDTTLSICRILIPIMRRRGVMAIVNDRADLAARAGADGVHLGQDDGTIADARRIMGPQAIIGVTCHGSKDLAITAAEQGADYVAFGAFFPTVTKAVSHHASPDILGWCRDFLNVPCVAIGGITPATTPNLLTAGADMVAVSAAVWAHPAGPVAAIHAFAHSGNTASVGT